MLWGTLLEARSPEASRQDLYDHGSHCDFSPAEEEGSGEGSGGPFWGIFGIRNERKLQIVAAESNSNPIVLSGDTNVFIFSQWYWKI